LDTKEFLEMDHDVRVKKINTMLQEYEEYSLKKVSEVVGINYSTFCKEMARGDYVYIKRDNKYYKFIKDTNASFSHITNYTLELNFIRDNLAKLETLMSYTNASFALDKRVYMSDSLVNKNIKISENIYNEFIDICQTHYPYLKIQDIVSQCLLNFINTCR